VVNQEAGIRQSVPVDQYTATSVAIMHAIYTLIYFAIDEQIN
jgi:hypothetical protein